MMVLLLLADALVAHHRLAGLDALDEAKALELVEDPVDARPAHPPRWLAAQRILDLERRQRACLAAEQLEHRVPCAAALATRRRERLLRPLDPGGALHRRIPETQ